MLVAFAASTYVIVPLPLPLEPEAMVIHEPLGVAVQAQPVPAVIKTELVRAVAGAFVLAGVKEYVQAGAAAWSIVTVAPAIVMVPVRGVRAMLAVTE